MFKLLKCEDTIRIPPDKFGEELDAVAHDQMRKYYEGTVTPDLGYVIAVVDVSVDHTGKIIPGDEATYHRSTFTLLTFHPEMQEVVEGEAVEIEDFGAFLRIGPIDALLHVSQIFDDFISFDERQGVLLGKATQRTLKQGDQVRARVIAVSIARGGSSGKIGVTCRQPFLGKPEWIEADLSKLRGAAELKKGKAVEEPEQQ